MRMRVIGAGMVELPQSVVRQFRLKPGDELEIFLDGERAVLYPVRSEAEGGREAADGQRESLLDAESARKSLERRLHQEFE